MVDKGYWVSENSKTDFSVYYKNANWISSMFDLIEDKSQLDMLNELKVFHSKTNSKGVVRDHIFGRMDGFVHGVFVEILRHPCNCQILTHSDNVKKKSSRYSDRSDISLAELFARIRSYTGEWKEHEIVLKLIDDYESGMRWGR